jgi:hypothetical protein
MGALKQDPAQVKADATKVLGINTHTTHTTKVLENIQRGQPFHQYRESVRDACAGRVYRKKII